MVKKKKTLFLINIVNNILINIKFEHSSEQKEVENHTVTVIQKTKNIAEEKNDTKLDVKLNHDNLVLSSEKILNNST